MKKTTLILFLLTCKAINCANIAELEKPRDEFACIGYAMIFSSPFFCCTVSPAFGAGFCVSGGCSVCKATNLEKEIFADYLKQKIAERDRYASTGKLREADLYTKILAPLSYTKPEHKRMN